MKRWIFLFFLLTAPLCAQDFGKVIVPPVSQRPPVPNRTQGAVNNPNICAGLDYYYGSGRARQGSYVGGGYPSLGYDTYNYGRPGYRDPQVDSYHTRCDRKRKDSLADPDYQRCDLKNRH